MAPPAGSARAVSASSTRRFSPVEARAPANSRASERTANGSNGIPGMRPSIATAAAAMRSGRGEPNSWPTRSPPRPLRFSFCTRVTTRPDATEMSSAGTWETSPSPMLSRAYRPIASPRLIPFCSTPIAKPPIRFTTTITMPAIASPLTNLLAPSIAP